VSASLSLRSALRRALPRERVITVAALAGLAAIPVFVTSEFLLSMLIFAGAYAIVAIGLTLLLGYAGQISFGHGGFYGLGAYVSALAALRLGWPVWLTIPLAAGAAGMVGYALGLRILRLRGLSLAMATLAFGQVMFILFRQLTITQGSLGLSSIPSPTIGPLVINTSRTYYFLVLVALVIVFVVTRNITRSATGRALRAVGGSETAAATVGVDVARWKARAFAYSALLAGLAGALVAHYVTYISSDGFSLDLSVFFVVVVAIGGVHSLWGAILGALVMTVVPQLLSGSLEALSALAYGALLTVVFMWARRGLIGVVENAVDWLARKRPRTADMPT
jgi:branched-chain amino acid transport system permease protein